MRSCGKTEETNICTVGAAHWFYPKLLHVQNKNFFRSVLIRYIVRGSKFSLYIE